MIEKNDVEYLEKVFDSRYVRQSECDRNVEKTDEHINQIKISTTQIATKLNLIAAILGGIGAAFLTVVVKILFGG